MRNNHLPNLLLIFFLSFQLASPAAIIDSIPKGWRATLETSPDVIMGIDTIIKRSGRASGFIKRLPIESNGYGTMMQSIEANEYRNKMVRISVYVKCKDVERGGLYFRVDGKETALRHTYSSKQYIEETMDWTLFQLTLDVPEESRNIDFGATLVGEGTLWLDDYKLEVVEKTTADDNMITEESKTRKLPIRNYLPNKKAINLGFEEL